MFAIKHHDVDDVKGQNAQIQKIQQRGGGIRHEEENRRQQRPKHFEDGDRHRLTTDIVTPDEH